MEPSKVTEPAEQRQSTPGEQLTSGGDAHVAQRTDREEVFNLQDVGVAYGGNPAVRQMTFPIYKQEITAFIGPSGCGKSTLIRCLNRMNDLIPSATVSGKILYHGEDLYGAGIDPVQVRKRIG